MVSSWCLDWVPLVSDNYAEQIVEVGQKNPQRSLRCRELLLCPALNQKIFFVGSSKTRKILMIFPSDFLPDFQIIPSVLKSGQNATSERK